MLLILPPNVSFSSKNNKHNGSLVRIRKSEGIYDSNNVSGTDVIDDDEGSDLTEKFERLQMQLKLQKDSEAYKRTVPTTTYPVVLL